MSIWQHDLWDIWFHPDSFVYNRRFCLDDLGLACRSCDRAGECLGGCSAMSYGATDRLHNDPYCFYGIRHRSTSITEEGQWASVDRREPLQPLSQW